MSRMAMNIPTTMAMNPAHSRQPTFVGVGVGGITGAASLFAPARDGRHRGAPQAKPDGVRSACVDLGGD
jgi:hypothetical protein